MIDISRLFFIQFMDKNISRQEFRSFVEDFLKKLAVQNTDGKYTAMLNATLNAYEIFFGTLTNLDVKNAIQQSRTGSMNAAIKDFKTGMQTWGLVIEGTFKGEPGLQEFFPVGRTEYGNANLQNVETLMVRMVAATEKFKSKLGGMIPDAYKKYLENFKAARGDQQTQIAQVSDARQDTEEARLVLAKLLTENVLEIAKNNVGHPEVAKLFFNQLLLENKTASHDEVPANPA